MGRPDPRPADPRRREATRLARLRADPAWLAVLGGVLGAAGLLVLYPLGILLVESVRGAGGPTLAHYGEVVRDPDLRQVVANTFWVAAVTTAACLLLGVPLAWALARTDLPGREAVRTLSALTLASPSFLGALAWVLLLGPRAGKVNRLLMDLFALEAPPFDIFSPWGVVFVLTLFCYPLVLLPVAAALETLDRSLEDASRVLGAGRLRTAWAVTLPLAGPAILSGAILVFVEAMVLFGPVAVLGVPVQFHTLPTKLLTLMRLPPRLELAAVLTVPLVLTLGVLLVLQRAWLGRRRFTVTTGRGQRPDRVSLGPWRWPLAALAFGVVGVAVGLPYGTLLLVSLQQSLGRPFGPDNFAGLAHYRYLFAQSAVPRALLHSFGLAVAGVLGALVLGLAAAWLVERVRGWHRTVLPGLLLAPFALPGAALGVALVLAFGGPPFALAGTLTILGLAYVVRSLPVTFAYARSALVQLSPELEEASRTLGASWGRTLRSVTLPLLREGVLAAAVVQFVLLFRELGTSVFLYTGGNEVTAVVIYDFAQEAQFTLVAALSVIVAAVNLGVVALVRRGLVRRGWP